MKVLRNKIENAQRKLPAITHNPSGMGGGDSDYQTLTSMTHSEFKKFEKSVYNTHASTASTHHNIIGKKKTFRDASSSVAGKETPLSNIFPKDPNELKMMMDQNNMGQYANNKILKYSKGANFLKKKKLESLLGGEHQSTTSSILGNNRKRDSIFKGENLQESPDNSFHTMTPAHDNLKVYLQPVNNLRKQGINGLSNTSSFLSQTSP